ncbi:hypothetical protein KO500_09815 [Cellulophaga baltica]|uniref:hypothetical protein n=1 Tax=Cellulophaga TaxID=104264 RepID=UPI001C074669|nr:MULTISPECIES: hypothetical protein [Cellulophaga]MBU2996732.1 hypothetical protein [Cellulophaga baltica]MDO6768128.1 hypothetical protein [Cellulophaga sp. 1_MG-2023]
MKKEPLEINTITKKNLVEYLNNNSLWSFKNGYYPFSKSKATWLTKNPLISDDDICAVIATENQELVSFVGLVPDFINLNNKKHKIYWTNRWWVANSHKNTILPTYVLNTALNAAKNKVLIKYLGKEVEEFYEKQPFKKFSERTRYIIIFSLDSNLISGKFPFLKKLSGIMSFFDNVSYALLKKINKIKLPKKNKEIKYNYFSQINNDDWSTIQQIINNKDTIKSLDYFNWQICNNQYTITTMSKKNENSCLLDSTSKLIYNLNFFIIHNENEIGFISALIKDRKFIIRYFECVSETKFELCLSALMENFINTNTTFIQTDNALLADEIQKNYKYILANKRKLYSYAHNSINEDFTSIKLQEHEGFFL